ncbi:hypothetical protein [Embleya sp. NPDC005971]|uniref:hypothetical protein n=1 Tax=unclassified Embleya TaxID=2699296 RepID=UPI0033E29C09
MSRGLAVPAATAGILAAVLSAIVALTARGTDDSGTGRHEMGTFVPATDHEPAAPPPAFTSIVRGARTAVDMRART